MKRNIKIYCANTHDYIEIEGGTTLADILRRIGPRIPFMPICARVNNKNEGLQYPVFSPKTIEFLPPTCPSGERVYIRSLCMILYKAVRQILPGVSLRIEHSISHGYYCTLSGGKPDAGTVRRLRECMRGIIDSDLTFEREERRTEDVIKLFEHQQLDDKVRLLKSTHELYTVYYRLEGVCDSYYSALALSTGCVDVFDLVPYEQGILLLGTDPHDRRKPRKPMAQPKMFEAFTEHLNFNRIIGVSDVGQLNEKVAQGKSAMIINVAEALQNKCFADIADRITARYRDGGARIVLVAGPSSSGKTTFTKRLAIQMMTNLLRPQMISLDDYFVNRDQTPRDESGEYDFESLYALDLEAFNRDLNALLRGEEVELPYYNFEKGQREYRGNRIKLGPGTILLIEGIHGLNPELTAGIDPSMKYTVYVSALTTISIDDHNWIPTTDNRMLRRIIRDYKYRGVSAVETIRRWPSVRRGEERWIFPYQENADSMFNSSLLFELGVMKERGESILRQVPRDTPEYAEAYRLRLFLSYFSPISEEYIPSTSLLREFLGGSSFHY